MSAGGQPRRVAVLLGHGSPHDPESSRPIRLQAAAIEALGIYHEVHVAFWKEPPLIQGLFDRVESEEVLMVPYLMSRGYFSDQVFPQVLGLVQGVTRRGWRRIAYGEPVGTHPWMTEAIHRCAMSAIEESGSPIPPGRELGLVIVGHGTGRHEGSAEAVREHALRLESRGGYGQVLYAFMEEEPLDREVLRNIRTPSVVVVPFFVGDGPHTRVDIPRNMGFSPMVGSSHYPIRDITSIIRRLWYTPAMGLGPWMRDVVRSRFRELEALLDRYDASG